LDITYEIDPSDPNYRFTGFGMVELRDSKTDTLTHSNKVQQVARYWDLTFTLNGKEYTFTNYDLYAYDVLTLLCAPNVGLIHVLSDKSSEMSGFYFINDTGYTINSISVRHNTETNWSELPLSQSVDSGGYVKITLGGRWEGMTGSYDLRIGSIEFLGITLQKIVTLNLSENPDGTFALKWCS
jgi:hypothetical protein